MFTPDFYLPDLDLYLELTTMKQSLVTRKNRKLRELRALYPDVNIRLLYRRTTGAPGQVRVPGNHPAQPENIDHVMLSSGEIQAGVAR